MFDIFKIWYIHNTGHKQIESILIENGASENGNLITCYYWQFGIGIKMIISLIGSMHRKCRFFRKKWKYKNQIIISFNVVAIVSWIFSMLAVSIIFWAIYKSTHFFLFFKSMEVVHTSRHPMSSDTVFKMALIVRKCSRFTKNGFS